MLPGVVAVGGDARHVQSFGLSGIWKGDSAASCFHSLPDSLPSQNPSSLCLCFFAVHLVIDASVPLSGESPVTRRRGLGRLQMGLSPCTSLTIIRFRIPLYASIKIFALVNALMVLSFALIDLRKAYCLLH